MATGYWAKLVCSWQKWQASIITTVCFITLLIQRYNEQFLPLLRQFLLIPNGINKFMDVRALINSFFLFLTCLLTSRLILFRLSTFIWLGSCQRCILAGFIRSKNRKHSSSNHGWSCFNLCRPKLSLVGVLMFTVKSSQALLTSSPSLKFSEAANLFKISVWYCFLTSSSFSLLRLNLSP